MKDNLLKLNLKKDYSERKNIGTFTSIFRSPMLQEYIDYYLNKNFVDKNAYESLHYLKEDVLSNFFHSLFEIKEGKILTTSGSTESILLALFYAREKAKVEKGINKPNIIVGENTHYSIQNCARFLKIHVKYAGLNDKYEINIKDVEKRIDKNTILLVGTLGTTELGVVDNILLLDKLAIEYNIPLHIDAAIGGFILPFLEKNNDYSFSSLKSLFSMNISGHKFGLALPGSGILLLREKHLIDNHGGEIEYLSSGKSIVENLLISSNSLGVLSLGINILSLGKEGYKNLAENYLKTKKVLQRELDNLKVDYFSGSNYMPQLFLHPENVKEISKKLAENGWIQHTYKPKGLQKEGIRIVIKNNQEMLLEKDLLDDLKFWNKEMKGENYIYE